MEKLGKRLMILSAAPHSYNEKNEPTSYEPYVREVNLWSELFDEVQIFTLIQPYDEKQQHKFATFRDSDVKLKSLLSFDASKGLLQKIGVILTLPIVTIQLAIALRKYEVVNIRNSGFYSIVLGILTRLLNKRTITKWAGSYQTFKGESFITKIDRRVINLFHKRHKVLIYDKVYKKHFVQFIPALMSRSEIQRAKTLAKEKIKLKKHLEIVAIGRLYWAKNFELIFEALNVLKQDKINFSWHFHMIGDGALREKLETMASSFSLNENITFHGALPFNEAQLLLAKSHALIMPGVMEGWPKPIAEAWAHDVYPIAANKGNIPDIITSVDRGIAFEPTKEELANSIKKAYHYLIEHETSNFTVYAKEYSLENFQKELIEIIKETK
jgi:glycosyltransferase involved in cell wall biosynthesis